MNSRTDSISDPVTGLHRLLSPSLWFDRIGMGLSLACAIHCVATPLLVALLPLAGTSFLVEEQIEATLILVSVTFSAGNLCWGFRLHRKRRALLILGASLAFIATGQLVSEGPYEVVLLVSGALLLASSQLLNRRLCRTCLRCHDQ
jgi:hypothetical protein